MLVKDFIEMLFDDEECRYIYIHDSAGYDRYCYIAENKEDVINYFEKREVRKFGIGTYNFEEPVLHIYLA